MIVAPSDFSKGDFYIPNAASLNSGEATNEGLLAIIEKYEGELLLNVLGKDQYDDLVLELPWIMLREYGQDYLDEFDLDLDDSEENLYGSTPKLVDSISEELYKELIFGAGQLRLLVQSYVYCKWIEKDEIKEGTVAWGKLNADGVNTGDVSKKYVDRWNEFVYLYKYQTYLYLSETPEFDIAFDLYDQNTASFGVIPQERNSFGIWFI